MVTGLLDFPSKTNKKGKPMTTATFEAPNSAIAKALVAFQAELPKVELNAENPHFKSRFTNLTELTNKAFPVLAKHGLSYTASPQVTDLGFVLEATLLHETGEFLRASFPITDTNPQKIGSAVSYFRRYGLASLTGIVADTDDDGNAASAGPTAAEQKIANARAPRTPAKPATPRPSNGSARDTIRVEYIESGIVTKETVNEMHTAAKTAGLAGDAAFEQVLERLKKGEVG